jgi:hypothetical protein
MVARTYPCYQPHCMSRLLPNAQLPGVGSGQLSLHDLGAIWCHAVAAASDEKLYIWWALLGTRDKLLLSSGILLRL